MRRFVKAPYTGTICVFFNISILFQFFGTQSKCLMYLSAAGQKGDTAKAAFACLFGAYDSGTAPLGATLMVTGRLSNVTGRRLILTFIIKIV
jgi:hypothetical protein